MFESEIGESASNFIIYLDFKYRILASCRNLFETIATILRVIQKKRNKIGGLVSWLFGIQKSTWQRHLKSTWCGSVFDSCVTTSNLYLNTVLNILEQLSMHRHETKRIIYKVESDECVPCGQRPDVLWTA